MRTRAQAWLRLVHRIHRLLGTALALLIGAWFVSGGVMLFARYPAYDDAERLAHAPVIAGEITPDLAALASWLQSAGSAAGARARLAMLEGRPTWTFTDGNGVRRALDAGTARALSQLGPERARAEAERRFALHAVRATLVELADQWLVGRGQVELYPFFRVEFDDPAHTQAYVSARSGEIAQASTRRERVLAWLGAIPHWLYPAILRRERELWRSAVLVLASLGLVLSLSGLVAGLHGQRLTRRRPQSGRRTSVRNPYLRWHQRIGLGFGVFASTWSFSGALSLSPFHWSGPGLGEAQLERWHGAAVAATSRLARVPEALTLCRRELQVRELELSTWAGRVLVTCSDGARSRSFDLDEPALTPRRYLARELLLAASARAAATNPWELSWQSAPDAYHYPTHSQPQFVLPYVRLTIADPEHTTYYLDPATARVIDYSTDRRRLERWLYNGLHSWDFAWLYRQPLLWRAGMLSAMALGAALSWLGIALPIARARRRRRTRSRAFAPQPPNVIHRLRRR